MRSRFSQWLVAAIFFGGSVLSGPDAPAEARYYAMIFAAEGNPNIPRVAHSFAVFIKVSDPKDGNAGDGTIEVHTISWLPKNLDVRLLVSSPQEGVNLDLQATLKFAASQKAVVSAWGPFQVQKELHDRALAQIKRLNTGGVEYKAVDRRFRPSVATNCFHAISDIVDGPLLDTGTAYGISASRMVMNHLAPWFVEPRERHSELVKGLGLSEYSINYRDESPPPAQKGMR